MAFIEFEISKSGLFASQRGLQTTMNNITNATTEGFSRRVLGQKAEMPLGNVKTGMLGMGVQTTGVTRMRDSYIDQKIWGNSPILGEYNVKVQQNYLIEAAFNEPSDTGFTQIFNAMFNAISDLSTNPSDNVYKTNVKETMVTFSKYYNNISGTLTKYQQDLNFEIKNMVNEINSLSINIRDLNDEILRAEIYGNEASDLRDQRDKCLDRLAELIDIEVEENEVQTKGSTVQRMTVRAAGQVLVDDKVCNTFDITMRGEAERQINAKIAKLREAVENNDQTQIEQIVTEIQKISPNAKINKTTGNLEFTQRNGNVITLYGHDENQNVIINDAGNGRLNPEDADGLYDITWSSGLTFYMCDSTMSGELKGLIDMRDGAGSQGREAPSNTFNTYNGIPYYINRIDTYVRSFAKKMNNIYSSTEDGSIMIQPYKVDETHSVTSIKLDDNGKITDYIIKDEDGTVNTNIQLTEQQLQQLEQDYRPQYALFSYSSGNLQDTPVQSENMDYNQLNASNFSISYELFDDPTTMRTVYDEENPSDTSFMIKLLEQKDNKKMFNEGDPKDYMIAIFSELGVNSSEAEMIQATKNAVHLNLDNQRKSVSQVDTSEEFVYLIQYQQAYQASAKMMTTIDKIYDITINHLGTI